MTATVSLLRTTPTPSEADIARVMDRNVCRCGTYPRIVHAVKLAAERMRAAGSADFVTVVRDGTFAGVVAPTERLVRKAAAAIKADWSVPTDLQSSQSVYEHLKKTGTAGGGRGGTPTVVGDVATARAQAARTLDASYRIPYIAHVPLEPRSAVAEWTDGKLTVWTGTQRPFGVRNELAEAFRIPETQVRVIVPDTGSAVRRQAHGRVRDRSGATGEGGGEAGQAGLDACRGVQVRLLQACRRHRREDGSRRRRADYGVGIR